MEFTVRNHRLGSLSGPVPFVASPNIGQALRPKFLVIHYTASGPNFDTAQYFSKPAAKVSAHLVIRRDGSVKQCVGFDRAAFHAGQSRWVDRNGVSFTGLNAHAIGIEIENWGPLTRKGDAWVSWSGQAVDAAKAVEAVHKSGAPKGGWEVFTAAQIDAAAAAARAIVRAYGIEEIVGHDDISPSRKSDPGPAWPMQEFKARVAACERVTEEA